MERRTFLTAAAASSIMAGPLTRLGHAQSISSSAGTRGGSASYLTAEIDVAGNRIFYRLYGQGPPILMVHGFPGTSLMWRFLAPKLAANHNSKRAMAKELVDVMDKLGFPTFALIGHDRGGRVSYRMTLDHRNNVERLAVFDVIPILEAWNRSDARFAQTYWPRILLSQKDPLPESYLLAVFHNPFGQGSFGPDILAEYVSSFRDPARVHGICEEYRAAATIEVEHDRTDKESSRRIECPMLHLWAEGGPLDTFYRNDGGPLGIGGCGLRTCTDRP